MENEFIKIASKNNSSKHKFYWSNDKYLGYAYMGVDGFYVFVFNDSIVNSCWSEHVLRAIADKLTELNKEWSEQIDKYFIEENNSIVANQNTFNAENFYLNKLE